MCDRLAHEHFPGLTLEESEEYRRYERIPFECLAASSDWHRYLELRDRMQSIFPVMVD
jgi:hypothetical protein